MNPITKPEQGIDREAVLRSLDQLSDYIEELDVIVEGSRIVVTGFVYDFFMKFWVSMNLNNAFSEMNIENNLDVQSRNA